jgi:hypothetical protein
LPPPTIPSVKATVLLLLLPTRMAMTES